MHDLTTFTYKQIKKATEICTLNSCSLPEALDIIQQEDRHKANNLRKLQNLDTRKMSKQEVIDETFKMPELSLDMYELLKDCNGFMTGSNVIADIDNPNDEDWCVQIAPVAFMEYSIGHNDNGYWEADGFSSVYCHREGKLINIICFSDGALFNAWKFTTEVMKSLKTYAGELSYFTTIDMHDILKTKWKRVRLFRALKDISYVPIHKQTMSKDDALKYYSCKDCSREAINFTCKAAREHYQETAVCERCSGITY